MAAWRSIGGRPDRSAVSGLGALGLFGMGMAPSLQYRVASLAGPGGQLAQSLPTSAINIGIAFGASVGGVAIGAYAATATVVAGLVIAVVSVAVAGATSFLRTPPVGVTVRQNEEKIA